MQRSGRRTAAADDHAGWGVALSGERGGLAGVQGEAEARQRNGTSHRCFVDNERNVHRPVGARHLGEFAGAVERVNDPGALGVEPGKVVLAFLAKHRIVGPLLGESAHQQFVGLAVAFGFEHGRWSVFGGESLAHGEQEFTCFGGEAGGELVIVEEHAADTTRPVWRNATAACRRHTSQRGLAVSRE